MNYNKLTNVLSKKVNKDLRKLEQYHNKDTFITIKRFNTETSGSWSPCFEISIDFQDIENDVENNERTLWTLISNLLKFDNENKTIFRTVDGKIYEIDLELIICDETETINIKYFYA